MTKEETKAYQKVYYEANKDKKKVYHEANKDKRKAYYEAYYKANKDKIKVRQAPYRKAYGANIVRNLKDTYIKNLITNSTNLRFSDVTQEMIDIKRTQLQIHRFINN